MQVGSAIFDPESHEANVVLCGLFIIVKKLLNVIKILDQWQSKMKLACTRPDALAPQHTGLQVHLNCY